MLRRPEPPARRPVGAAGCLGQAVGPGVSALDVVLLGSREDDHGGPVSGRIELAEHVTRETWVDPAPA
eukprot:4127078-Alexandrium_andersonii.AAC.1